MFCPFCSTLFNCSAQIFVDSNERGFAGHASQESSHHENNYILLLSQFFPRAFRSFFFHFRYPLSLLSQDLTVDKLNKQLVLTQPRLPLFSKGGRLLSAERLFSPKSNIRRSHGSTYGCALVLSETSSSR
jgi:hypothetical protein